MLTQSLFTTVTVVVIIMPVPTTVLLSREEEKKGRLIVLRRKLRCRERKSCRGKMLTHIFVAACNGTTRPNLDIYLKWHVIGTICVDCTPPEQM